MIWIKPWLYVAGRSVLVLYPPADMNVGNVQNVDKIEMSRMSKMSLYRMLEMFRIKQKNSWESGISRYQESRILSTHIKPGLSNSAIGWHLLPGIYRGPFVPKAPVNNGGPAVPALGVMRDLRPPPEQYVIQEVQAQGTEVHNFQRDTTAQLTVLEHATALSRCHQTWAPDLTVCQKMWRFRQQGLTKHNRQFI